MEEPDKFIAEFKCCNREDLTSKLLKDGSVDSLTKLKLTLVEKCKEIEGFPKGEFYSRRKPKGTSTYSSLEERLTDDIAELLNFLDTEIVTPEVRNMFKMAANPVEENHAKSTENNMSQADRRCSSLSMPNFDDWKWAQNCERKPIEKSSVARRFMNYKKSSKLRVAPLTFSRKTT